MPRNRITIAQSEFLLRLELAGSKGIKQPKKGGAQRSAWVRTVRALIKKDLVVVNDEIAYKK